MQFKPTNPEHLKKYVLDITDEWETSRGAGWVGLVHANGEPSFAVENLGDGGCNNYLYPDDASRALYKEFVSDAEKAFADDPLIIEKTDVAILWLEIRDLPEEVIDEITKIK